MLERGILPGGGGLILAGDSGVGKSLMRIEWSILLALGLPIYGMKTPNAQSVVVFQAENTMPQEQFRTRRVQDGLGIEKLPDRIYYAPPMWPCSVKNKDFFDYAIDRIRECSATVAFFDPLISYHNENENDNVKMRSALNAFTHISRETGAACVLIHHFGKPSTEGAPILEYRLRGAQAIRDWCDTAITISALKEQGGKRTLRRLDFIKIRNGPWHPPIILERNGSFIHEVTEEPGKCPPSLVVRVVARHGATVTTQNDLVKLLEDAAKCSRRTAQKAVTEALDLGYIEEGLVDGMRRYTSNREAE